MENKGEESREKYAVGRGEEESRVGVPKGVKLNSYPGDL